jgi:SAM-dependent methyltransferase
MEKIVGMKKRISYSAVSLIIIATIALLASFCKNDDKSKVSPTSPTALVTAKGSTLVMDCDFIDPSPEESAKHYRGEYMFSSDWFTPNVPAWRGALGHLRGRPNIHYLEVGLYEGRSAIWMLENILTDPTAHLTGIDVFPEDLEERWLINLERSGKGNQVTTIKGYSQKVLRDLPSESFDAIYIDGSHKGYDVLADAILSWDLLKPGGVLIFDDYQWRHGKGLPPELKPGPAIDAFITMYRDFIQVIHRCYQLMLVKQPNPCAGTEPCSPIGSHVYIWKKGILKYHKIVIQISDKERQFIETLLHSRAPGRTDVTVPEELLGSEEFTRFVRRFKLKSILPVPTELYRLRELYGLARYTKNDEELFIRYYFKDLWDGVFVDIDAGHNGEYSHTLFLELHLGWSGIVLEPLRKLAAGHRPHRPNSKFFNYHISKQPRKNREFLIVNDYNKQSSDADHVMDERQYDSTPRATIRLTELLERENIEHIDFLHLDLATAELEALIGFDISRFRPELVCIRVYESTQEQIEKYFSDYGYVLVEEYSRLDPNNKYYRPR